jgi:hypothetical protein
MANEMTIDDINKYFQDIYTVPKDYGVWPDGEAVFKKGDYIVESDIGAGGPVKDIRNLSDEQLKNLLNNYFGVFNVEERGGIVNIGGDTTTEGNKALRGALENIAFKRGAQTEALDLDGVTADMLPIFIPPRESDPLSGSDFTFDSAVADAQKGEVIFPREENYAELRSADYPFEILASVPEFAHSLIDDLIAQSQQEGVSTEETANFQNLIDLIAARRR